MSYDWKSWCRLCGCKYRSEIDVFIKDENFFSLSEAIQRFLSISICDIDEAPKKICSTCQELLNDLVTFSMKATKVQEMYSELQFNDKFELFTNIDILREKYGLEFDEKLKLPTNEFVLDRSSDNDDDDDNDGDDADEDPNENKSLNVSRRKKRRIKKVVIKSEESDVSFEEKENPIEEIKNLDENIDVKHRIMDYVNNDMSVNNINSFAIKEEFSFDIPKKKLRKKLQQKTLKRSSKEPKIFCEVCNKGFSNQGGYKWHLKMAHQIVKNPETFACLTCGKIYQKLSQLKVHENMHLPPDQRKWYPCPHCDKKFTVESSVGNHIRTVHIKEKCFICEECGKSFVTNDALNSHKLVHTDYAPFQCPKCSKCFKRLPSLKNHLDSHDDTKYICPICGLQLNTKTTLRRHMVIHSDEKKYKCNFCGNQFKRSKALKNHLILHTGLKPYECPFCEQTFANGSNCRKHQKNSHTIELAAMEDAGEKKICKNVPRLEHLKAVNNAALCGLDIDLNHKIEKIDCNAALDNLQQQIVAVNTTIPVTATATVVTILETN